MDNTLLINDINRIIKFYAKEIEVINNNTADTERTEDFYNGKIEGYKEVLEMIMGYEKLYNK